jgi:hypothetical protein
MTMKLRAFLRAWEPKHVDVPVVANDEQMVADDDRVEHSCGW